MDTKDRPRPGTNKKRPVAPAAKSRRPAAQSRRRAPEQKAPTSDVVYTQPGPFNRNRFLLQILTVAAVVLALLFGMSLFFKVEVVTVAGTNKYTAWDVRQASGIQEGENLLTISKARLASNIMSKLPYVEKVSVGIKLPDTVKIEIEELDVVYAIEDNDGGWWLMRANGGIVDKVNNADALLHTRVLGVQITQPEIGKPAVPYQVVPDETTEAGQVVPVTVNAQDQLDAAISILQFLEDNSILGEVVSIDVSNLSDLQMWYGERFKILLGDTLQLSHKIKLVKTTIDEHMETYDSGTLDVSMTIKPDPNTDYQVIYTPFDSN